MTAAGIEAQRHLPDRQYLVLFMESAVVSALLGAGMKIPFSSKPVAVYGISGFVFALATFLLVHLYLAHDEPLLSSEGFNVRRHPLELIAILLGISVLLLVAVDVGQAFLNDFRGVNGGHLGGAILGILEAYGQRSDCSISD
jgi:hypothetical protein